MSRQKVFLGTLLVALSSILAVTAISGHQLPLIPDLSSLSEAELNGVTIHFERIQCYGTCPAYALTIHGDGRVQYYGKEYVQIKGAKEGKMEAGAVEALVSQFGRTKFISLPDYQLQGCKCRHCTDLPSAVTEIAVAGVQHRVRHDYGCGCAPKELFELESAIDKAAKVEQWTGDVSKQGPFGTTCSK
jgi:hypothetical protein